jgi:hypothetical protein
MVLDIAAYNKNIISEPTYRLLTRYDPVLNRDVNLRTLTNLDFGTVRGLDVRLDRRFGRFFNGTVGYTYQHSQSTGSDPYTYIWYGSVIPNPTTGGVQAPPQGIFPTDYSRPHVLTGAFSLTIPSDWRRGSILGAILGNVRLFSTLRFTSGSAYSRCGSSPDDMNVLSSESCWRQYPDGLNSQRLPTYREVNARLTKSFELRGVDVTGYLDVRNLLNFENVLQVFATNGSIRNDAEREANLGADLGDLALEGAMNGVLGPDGSLLLDFPHERCGSWVATIDSRSATANCVYLIRAEQRYGDGDGIYTVDEQAAAINALYDVARGEHQYLGPPRRARLGIELSF